MTGPLIELVGDYLLVRRALGYQLEDTEVVLRQFVAYLAEHDADTITIEHALGFATAPEGASPRWQALRLSAIRCFARWAAASDFMGRDRIIASAKPGMALWRETLFVVMSRNATNAANFFGLPPDRIVALGTQVEI